MKNSADIIAEIKNTAPTLAGVSKQMPYTVPAGYFEQLTGHLVAMSLLHQEIPHELSQDVPEGYFEQLPDLLLQKIKALSSQNELDEIAPTLATANRTMPYQVPTGYFEALQPMQAVIPAATPAASPLRRWVPLMRLAAAVLVLVAAFGIWQMSKNTTAETATEVAANDFSDIDTASLGLALAGLDDETISGSVQEAGLSTYSPSSLYFYDPKNVEEALQHFSTEIITQYLQELPAAEKEI